MLPTNCANKLSIYPHKLQAHELMQESWWEIVTGVDTVNEISRAIRVLSARINAHSNFKVGRSVPGIPFIALCNESPRHHYAPSSPLPHPSAFSLRHPSNARTVCSNQNSLQLQSGIEGVRNLFNTLGVPRNPSSTPSRFYGELIACGLLHSLHFLVKTFFFKI